MASPPRTARPTPTISTSSAVKPTITTSHHRRKSSNASPIEMASRSPAARRMSMSTTSQSAALPESVLDRVLDRPGRVIAPLAAAIVSLGTVYSLVYSTAQNTSLDNLLPHASYFARKSNIFNQYLVKLSWFWTSLIYLLHLWSSPSTRTFAPWLRTKSSTAVEGKMTRMIAFGLATFCWVIFTSWFFGAGLGDRIIQLSGGACAVALPAELAQDVKSIQKAVGSVPGLDLSEVFVGGSDSDRVYLSLPSTFCSLQRASSLSSHPELYTALQSSFPSLATSLVLPSPRWHRGFDISGHIFLLTLSALLLSRELSPSIKMLLRRRIAGEMSQPIRLLNERHTGFNGQVHSVATTAGIILVGVWMWMLLMTSVWFHTPQEKLSGLLLGLGSYALVDTLTPSTKKHKPKPNSPIIRPGPLLAEDENRARRGQVIDEGVILEESEEGSPSIQITPPQDYFKKIPPLKDADEQERKDGKEKTE